MKQTRNHIDKHTLLYNLNNAKERRKYMKMIFRRNTYGPGESKANDDVGIAYFV